MFNDGDGGTATMAKPKKPKGVPVQTKTVRITEAAYEMLTRLAGMKLMDLGDCNSDLILRYGEKELSDEFHRVTAKKSVRPKD